jgi:hypothetical protein
LNTTLTPHSIIHGDACFAYFNKIWGIPFSDVPVGLGEVLKFLSATYWLRHSLIVRATLDFRQLSPSYAAMVVT